MYVPEIALSGFENERNMLEQFRKGDPMGSCAPEFHGVVEIDGKRYLKMRSLFEGFDSATLCQMDCKMGVRCFAESELQSTKSRSDLFERLLKMDASEVTPEEHASHAITKARWMDIRDHRSSTATLGFRVDGVVTPTRERHAFGDLASVRSDDEVADALRTFLPEKCSCRGGRKALVKQLLARLSELESSLHASPLFRDCEVIGSSILFAADGNGKCGLWMLDFGVTGKSPTGPLKHNVPWTRGNHEDGYLTGLANMQRLWRKVLDEL